MEAPDNVFEGWGYLDGEFIKPTPPEGWLYDEATGCFYLEGEDPPPLPEPILEPEQVPTLADDLMTMAVDHEYRLTILELGVI